MSTYRSPLSKAWEDLGRFFGRWELSPEEICIILGIDEEVYESWVRSDAMSMSPRIIERCAQCYGLHEALLLHFKEDRAYAWVQAANDAPIFRGRTAIRTICEDLEENPSIIRDIIGYVRTQAI